MIFLGCDPEVFVREKETGVVVPAVDLVPGTKEAPHLVPGGMIQVDGLALEFGVDPSATLEEFQGNINRVVAELEARLPDHLELAWGVTSTTFSGVQLEGLPEYNLQLGCEPDYSAYTLETNPSPAPPSPGFRTVGGHVHVGWGVDLDPRNTSHFNSCARLAVELDYLLGLPSLAWDGDTQRRSLYGGPGAFRPKSYGMEYRTLSNAWVNDPELVAFVFHQTHQAIARCNRGSFRSMEPLSSSCSLTPRQAIEQGAEFAGKAFFNIWNRGQRTYVR